MRYKASLTTVKRTQWSAELQLSTLKHLLQAQEYLHRRYCLKHLFPQQ